VTPKAIAGSAAPDGSFRLILSTQDLRSCENTKFLHLAIFVLFHSKDTIRGYFATRTILGSAMFKSAIAVAVYMGLLGPAQAQDELVYKFDNLTRIGGQTPKVEGSPKIVDTPAGKGMLFDGNSTVLTFDNRPLVGAKAFTEEVIIHPDGGLDGTSQRVTHIAETDPATGLDARPDYTGHNDPNPRIMTELHVTKGQWYLHVYMRSKSGPLVLQYADKLHPFGAWYTLALTYDGKTFRSYVNGVQEGEGEVSWTPQAGSGHMAVGTRMDHVTYLKGTYFKGTLVEARFTTRALTPGELLKAPQ
jgi:hypothetical protein